MAGAVEPGAPAGFFNMIPMVNKGDLQSLNGCAEDDNFGEGWTKSSARLLQRWYEEARTDNAAKVPGDEVHI